MPVAGLRAALDTVSHRLGRAGRQVLLLGLVGAVVLGLVPGLTSAAQAAATKPGTPSITAATGGDRQATLVFTPPSDGGSPIIGYTASFSGGGTTGTASCTGSPCVVPGLTNGTTYSFTLVATNAVGDSVASAAKTALPRSVPGAPTDVSVAGGSAQATVSFNPPADNGGSVITGYKITATPTAGGAAVTKTFTSSPATFTQLSNGKEYAFTLVATNAAGDSTATDPVKALVATVPSAPTLSNAVAGDKQVVLTFTGSVNNGGSPISGYTASYYSTSDGTVYTSPCSVSPCTVAGLTNGATYVFSMTANNGVGSSPISAYKSATPKSLPGMPTDVVVTPGSGQATLTFKAPDDNGGSVVTGYRVTATPTAGGTAVVKTFTSAPSVFTQLSNGKEYSFVVATITAVGASPATDPVKATPVGAPAKPSVIATAGDGSVTLTFNAPTSNGTPITGYSASVSWFGTPVSVTACATSPCLIDGLTNGSQYTVQLVATNAVGSSPASDAQSFTPLGVPTVVRNLAATVSGTRVSVTWDAPVDDGGSSITGYQYRYVDGTAWSNTYSPSITSMSFFGTVGQDYDVVVRAVTALSVGREATVRASLVTAPSTPYSVSITPGDRQLTVSVQAPSANGAPVTGYRVTYYPASDPSSTTVVACPLDGCLLDGLTNGTSYGVRIEAQNSVGYSAPSYWSATPRTTPGKVSALSATTAQQQLFVSWGPPASDGGAPVTYEWKRASDSTWQASYLPSSLYLNGLAYGQPVTILIRATNAAGPGPSDSVTATPDLIQDAPLNLTATPGDRTATFTWDPPAPNGGTPVTRYEYQLDGASSWTDNGLNTSVVLSGLTNNTRVTFLVRSVSAAGPGHGTSTSVVPAKVVVPLNLRDLTATPGDRSVDVSWNAPTDAGGSAVARYEYQVLGASTWTDNGLKTSVTISGLTNLQPVTVLVRPVDVDGVTHAYQYVRATPDVAPDQVSNLHVTRGDRQATLVWSSPVGNGGSGVTGYEYKLATSDTWTQVGPRDFSATVTGLTNGAESTFLVRAVNGAGAGAVSSVKVTPDLVPGTVRNVTAVSGDRSATVSWDAPTANGGTPITRYEYQLDGDTSWTDNGLSTTAVVTGLVFDPSVAPRSIAIRAVNAAGAGEVRGLSVEPVRPATVPGTPLNIGASIDDRTGTITWDAPTDDGGSPLVRYEYKTHAGTDYFDPSGDGWTANGLATSVKVPDLEYGVLTTVYVRAVNVVGASQVTAAQLSAQKPFVYPGGVTNLTATPGDRSVTVAWGPPSNPDNLWFYYEYKLASDADWSYGALEHGVTIRNLVNGTPVTIQVRTVTDQGPNPPDSVQATPMAVPGQPVITGATPGDGTITVAFDPPADNGSPITGYTLSYFNGFTYYSPAACTTSPCQLTGLTNGTPYWFFITAKNAVGESSVSDTKLATPRTLPGEVTALAATPGDRAATVSWKEPADNGGSPVIRYEYKLDGATTWTDNGSQLTATVAGLTNGSEATVLVRAVNAAGPGPSDTVKVTPVKPDVAPAKIGGLSGTPGDGKATLGWTAPADNGGSPVTRYEYQLPGSTTWTSNGLATTLNLTGLTNGAETTVLVRAVNAAGTGSSDSVKVTPVKPDVAPAKVTGLSGTPGDGKATFGWTAPSDNGGSPVTRYEYQLPGSTTWTSNGLATTLNLAGLTNGTETTVLVRAVNAAGPGPSDTVKVTPVKPDVAPAKIGGLTGTPGDGKATLGWTAPSDNGGSPVTRYEYQLPGSTTWTSNGLATTLNLTGLTNGAETTVLVRAVNAAGPGPSDTVKVTPVKPDVAPAKVTGLTGTPGDAKATLVWTAPTDNAGSPVTRYEYQLPGSTVWSSNGLSTTLALNNLTNGSETTILVRAVNAAGAGPSDSVKVTPVKPDVAPGKVTGLTGTPGDGKATLGWTAPTDNAGSPITRYEYQLPGSTVWSSNGLSTTLALNNLTNGSETTVLVRAVNAAGPGPSDTVKVTPVKPDVAPAKIGGLTGTPGDGKATLGWTAPADNGGSPVTRYEYQLPGSTTWISNGLSTTLALNNLTNGAETTVLVRAVNAAGPGPSDTVKVTPVKPDVTPAKIGGLTGTPGDAKATLGWTAPADNGGSPVTRYEYQLPGSTTWISNGLSTTLALNNLTNGSETTVLVRAVNAAGPGPSDTVKVTPVKPDVAPAKIGGLTGTPGDGKATLGWTAPADNGGSPVVRYEYQLPGSTTWTSNGLATTLNLTGLTNGTETTVLVRAVNAAGPGPSDTVKVTPVKAKAVPGTPTELKVNRFDTYAVFGFKAPSSDGGSPITRYETSVDNGAWTPVQTTTGADGRPSFSLRGYTNATNHQVALRAVNAVGAGPATTPLCFTTIGKPTAPRAVTATPVSTTAGAVSVSWTAPASDGGSPIVDYTVTSSPAGGTCTTTTTSCTVTGLVPGRSYSFAVTARNTSVGFADTGTGPGATSASVCAPATPKPSVPPTITGLQGIGGDRTLTVTWDRPASTGSSPIARWEISVDDAKTWTVVSAVSSGTSRLSGTVEGVRNGATYPSRVRAVNAVGTGPSSAAIQVPVAAWFADPLTSAQRSALVAVPANPASYSGPVRWTKLNAMSLGGLPAMALDQLKGRQMQSGQATSMLGDAMFEFNTTTLTAKGTDQLKSLVSSLKYVKAVSCEGYADYGGPATNAQSLSTARAKLVCDRLKSSGATAVTSYQGYGDSKPVVVGGSFADRAANRRVVVTITQG